MPEWGKRKGGSHGLMETNVIRSPSLLFFRRQHGILYGKLFIEPNNLCSACSETLKPDPSTFEGWAWLAVGAHDKKTWWIPWPSVFQTMSERLWKTGTNRTRVIWLNSKQGEVLHSLNYPGWPNQRDDNLILHLTLQISPAHPVKKAAKLVQYYRLRHDRGTARGLILHLTRTVGGFCHWIQSEQKWR